MKFSLIPTAHAQEFKADYGAWMDKLNPGNKGVLSTKSTLGDIIGTLLPYLLTIAGLILFTMLIAGGFTMLSGAANKESQEKGKKMITGALTGFGIIFLAYWIAQILQVIFKVNIVS